VTDLLLQLRIEDEWPAGDPGQQLDGPVVVGRSQAAGGDDEVGLERLAESLLQRLGVVADDVDPLRLDP
jgi:hypothetical protein